MKVPNSKVASLLRQIAYQYKQSGDKWRAIAYGKASKTVRDLAYPLTDVDISSLSGIGSSIKEKIEEILETGKSSLLEELQKNGVPASLEELEKLQGVGPKTAMRLWKEYGVKSLQDLEENKALLKKEPEIAEALALYKRRRERIPVYLADKALQEICAILRSGGCKFVSQAGSCRRKKFLVRDLDVVVAISDSKKNKFMKYVRKNLKVVAGGESKLIFEYTVSGEPRNGDIVMVTPKEAGNAINYLTGSKQFNIAMRRLALRKGFTVNERETRSKYSGKRMPSATEEDLFDVLDIPFIPPECRIDGTEVGKDLSDLITHGSVKGDLHIHTTYSDGLMSLKMLVRSAKEAGLKFVGVADHSYSLGVTGGMKAKDVPRIRDKVKSLQFPVYFGVEADVKVDGSLPYKKKLLSEFDYLILATHSSPDRNLESRLIRAIKKVAGDNRVILAHLTNRKSDREAAEANWDNVFKICRRYDVAIEINAQPDRMDPPADLIRRAKRFGLKFVINSDTHDTSINLYWGVIQARKGLLENRDVINTSHKSFRKWLERR